jgi:hypothetical protein
MTAATFSASRDATIRSGAATSNDNTTAIRMSRDAAGTDFYRALFVFDVSSIPREASISTATLSLTVTSGTYGGVATFSVDRLTNSDWTETGVTWNKYDGTNDWTTPGGDYTATGEVTDDGGGGPAAISLTVTGMESLVSDAVINRSGLLNIIIRLETVGADNSWIGRSSEAVGNTPELAVIYETRLPSLMWQARKRYLQWSSPR